MAYFRNDNEWRGAARRFVPLSASGVRFSMEFEKNKTGKSVAFVFMAILVILNVGCRKGGVSFNFYYCDRW